MPSSITTINVPSAPKPMGRYSHAVRSDKPVLYLSGQMGEDPNTNEIVQGGIEAQTRQAFTNIATILEHAGSAMGRIVARRVFLVNIHRDIPSVSKISAEFFEAPYAASTAVQVGALAAPDALVEIEVVAEV